MRINIPYHTAYERHYDTVASILFSARIKNARNKKKVNINDQPWFYEYRIDVTKPHGTLESRLGATETFLCMSFPSNSIKSRVANPSEVVADVTKAWEKQVADKKRLDDMTPEQRKAEAHNILQALSLAGGSGFVRAALKRR